MHMLKTVGVLAFVLTAGALLQPVTALAADRNHARNEFAGREDTRVVREYREPVRNGDWRHDREVTRSAFALDHRVIVRTSPFYYYAPAPRSEIGRASCRERV